MSFQIHGVDVPPRVASPQLEFELEVRSAPAGERIHTAMLQCQVQVGAAHRAYNAREKERLRDLFGASEQWARALRSVHWAQVDATVPAFTGRTVIDLPVPLSYDMNGASTKYLHALEEGEVPLRFLFRGTVFYAGAGGGLQVHRIARSKECSYRMPVARWKDAVERHYANTTWLALQRDAFERLHAYKRRHGLPTWEDVVEHLLPEAERKTEEVAP